MFNSGLLLVLATTAGLLSLAGFSMMAHKWMIVVDWEVLTLGSARLEVPVFLDLWGCAFVSSVLLISTAVLMFSQSYMSQEKFFLRFHLLVLAFVASMLLLVISPNLMSLLLGWDGLGVTSYLLVIYFQSTKSYNAGLLTALTNRIGDVLILLSLALLLSNGSWNYFSWAHDQASPEMAFVGPVMLVAACTKSAQIPFSAWLPAAMAAPTPVSSLVHSSTLVTAGVYLLFRFGELLAEIPLLNALFLLGLTTSIMASVSALKETDMKKIVALSTLSQLGLMMAAIGAGLYEVAFFHMLAHAYFKALLFMSVGQMIHLSSDFQDLRKISLSGLRFPPTLAFSLVANMGLCGIPFMAGFYSKDAILESVVTTSFPVVATGLLFSTVALTALYSVRFVIMVTGKSFSFLPLLSAEDNDIKMMGSMSILWPLAIAGGSLLSWGNFSSPLAIFMPTELKNLALGLIVASSVIGISFLWPNPLPNQNSVLHVWGLMWGLPMISSALPAYANLLMGGQLRKLDLSWSVSATWSVISSVVAPRSVDQIALSKFFPSLLGLLAWGLLVLVLIYLRM